MTTFNTDFTVQDIATRRHELLIGLEKEISNQLNQFVFNPHIQDLFGALTELQAICPHIDEKTGTTFTAEGECPFCGKKK